MPDISQPMCSCQASSATPSNKKRPYVKNTVCRIHAGNATSTTCEHHVYIVFTVWIFATTVVADPPHRGAHRSAPRQIRSQVATTATDSASRERRPASFAAPSGGSRQATSSRSARPRDAGKALTARPGTTTRRVVERVGSRGSPNEAP